MYNQEHILLQMMEMLEVIDALREEVQDARRAALVVCPVSIYQRIAKYLTSL